MAEQNIMLAIEPFMKEGKTGTAMTVFEDNSLGRIYLVDGVVTSVRYRNKEGLPALELAKKSKLVSVKFHNNTDIVRSREVLSAEPHAQEISGDQEDSGQRPDGPKDSAEPTKNQLSDLGRRRLSDLLSEYIGPVAPLVMADLKANVDVDTALRIVSREIDDSRRASEFVTAARQML